MTRYPKAVLAAALIGAFPSISNAQTPIATSAFSYADIADIAIGAPVAIDAQVRSATRMKLSDSVILKPGYARFVIEADVLALIRGASGIPPRVRYVTDLKLDSRGKPPKLKKARVLVFARPVPGKPADLQLVAPDAQLPWTAEADAMLRSILTETLSADSPPRIARVGNAFNVPGAIQGESETQIFLITDSGEPVSLSVIRRPGQVAKWAVALGEIVDESAASPRPQTMLWYRLACFLPRALPAESLENADPTTINQARADYKVVIDGLGQCVRNREQALQASLLPK